MPKPSPSARCTVRLRGSTIGSSALNSGAWRTWSRVRLSLTLPLWMESPKSSVFHPTATLRLPTPRKPPKSITAARVIAVGVDQDVDDVAHVLVAGAASHGFAHGALDRLHVDDRRRRARRLRLLPTAAAAGLASSCVGFVSGLRRPGGARLRRGGRVGLGRGSSWCPARRGRLTGPSAWAKPPAARKRTRLALARNVEDRITSPWGREQMGLEEAHAPGASRVG